MKSVESQTGRISLSSKWLLLTGAIFIALGGVIMWRPFHAYLIISYSISLLTIASGILELSHILRKPMKSTLQTVLFFEGIMDISIGLYFLVSPLLLMIVFTPLLGIWVFYKGLIGINLAMYFKRHRYAFWWIQLTMAVMVLFAAVTIGSNITSGYIDMIIWTGLGISLVGLSYITLSIAFNFTSNRELKSDENNSTLIQ